LSGPGVRQPTTSTNEKSPTGRRRPEAGRQNFYAGQHIDVNSLLPREAILLSTYAMSRHGVSNLAAPAASFAIFV
jgi:hypothetical protein